MLHELPHKKEFFAFLVDSTHNIDINRQPFIIIIRGLQSDVRFSIQVYQACKEKVG